MYTSFNTALIKLFPLTLDYLSYTALKISLCLARQSHLRQVFVQCYCLESIFSLEQINTINSLARHHFHSLVVMFLSDLFCVLQKTVKLNCKG